MQHTFNFELDLIADPGQVHKTLSILHTFCMTCGTLCARLSLKHFTYFQIFGAMIIADVQDTFCYDHDPFNHFGQGHTQHQILLNFRECGDIDHSGQPFFTHYLYVKFEFNYMHYDAMISC